MIGAWLGRYVGDWLGPTDATVDPPIDPPVPPTVGHGYGFLPERPKRRDTDDDALVLLLI